MATGSLPPHSTLPHSSAPEPLSQMSDISEPARKQKIYRQARPLPYELRQHTVTYVEEELYSQAISLLHNLLIAGTDNNLHENGRILPACVPHPQILAVAATLIVHPSTTNRAPSPEQVEAANDALSYLNHLNALVGSVNAQFSSAFQFPSTSGSRPGRLRARARNGSTPRPETEEPGRLRISLANHTSLWDRAEDFWRVVGWAFNCSIHHIARWDRWRLWLSFMLDVLEDDLDRCLAAANTKAEQDEQASRDAALAGSLLARYLAHIGEGRAGKRRIMRAILADGSKRSLAEFGEIWKNETREKNTPKDNHISEKEKLKFDKDDFSDYMDVDEGDDEDSEDIEREMLLPKERVSDDFGGVDSVLLRQRFMALLVKVCVNYEQAFLVDDDLFDLFTEFLRPMPLPVFTKFVLPTVPYLEPDAQASLNQTLLSLLISSDAPIYEADTMRQAEFEKHFLPFPAGQVNAVDNARVSLLVEGLLRLLVQHLGVESTSSLKRKLNDGIKARREKANSSTKERGDEKEAEHEMAMATLRLSAARMQCLVVAASM